MFFVTSLNTHVFLMIIFNLPPPQRGYEKQLLIGRVDKTMLDNKYVCSINNNNQSLALVIFRGFPTQILNKS